MYRRSSLLLMILTLAWGCSSSTPAALGGANPETQNDASADDGGTGTDPGADAALADSGGGGSDGGPGSDGGGGGGGLAGLGTVIKTSDEACPAGAPVGSTCKLITVGMCPGIAAESIDATVIILAPTGTPKGTVVHFSGGGGEGIESDGVKEYAAAGLLQVFVVWMSDWEQTSAAGIKAAGCRPSTVAKWVFDEPTLHGGSRTAAFCGQGFSGGAGQLGYALAHYGMSDYFDYVNELSGPPFARIDLGCDGDAPASATVCGATDTMMLPSKVANWENIPSPLSCGAKGVPAAELARWKNDSIAVGGVYDYPKTDVEFFTCTNNATAVTAMAQLYEGLIASTEGASGKVGYHCFSQADGCQGEGLGQGVQQAVSALVAGCVPRH